jgi:hypothetical protein
VAEFERVKVAERMTRLTQQRAGIKVRPGYRRRQHDTLAIIAQV